MMTSQHTGVVFSNIFQRSWWPCRHRGLWYPGTLNGEKYWKINNSWNEQWGDYGRYRQSASTSRTEERRSNHLLGLHHILTYFVVFYGWSLRLSSAITISGDYSKIFEIFFSKWCGVCLSPASFITIQVIPLTSRAGPPAFENLNAPYGGGCRYRIRNSISARASFSWFLCNGMGALVVLAWPLQLLVPIVSLFL